MKNFYRAEIDGLRALAIIAVVIYHAEIVIAGFKIFTGGYLGVDIFFVISGYIITKIIIKEYDEGKFSIKFFLYRRIRRIFPVLLLVAIVTISLGWYILVPTSFVQLSESIISSLFFSSNFYFNYSDQIYGNDNGLIKPFLHTWSLSIEEQFYIFFPFILIYSLRRKSQNLINLILILSFLSTFTFLIIPKENFYFIYSRAWELLIGTFICMNEEKIKRIKFFVSNLHILKLISIVLLFLCMMIYDHKTAHPSYLTLFPIILISILIIEDNQKKLVDNLLSIKIVVFVGIISYSLYLWHYPIFAFSRITEFATGDIFKKLLILISLIIISSLSYYLVEKPIRNVKKISKKILYTILIALFLILFVCLNIILNNGYVKRFENVFKEYSYEMDNEVLQKNSKKFLYKNYFDNIKTRNVLVMGDSHSIGIFNAFFLNQNLFKEFEFAWRRLEIQAFQDNKKLINTLDMNKKIKTTNETLNSQAFKESDVVVLSYRFSTKGIEGLEKLIKLLKENNKKIILMSQTNEYKTFSGIYSTEYDRFIQKKIKNKSKVNQNDVIQLMKKLYLEKKDFKNLNDKLMNIAFEQNIKFFSKQRYLCDENIAQCLVINDEGKKIFFDYGHLSLSGSKYVGKKLKEFEILNIEN
tara:strand:+ start:3475 stop:5394 length:1920 start_codon:yes stop_codon:yes gene_type:complete